MKLCVIEFRTSKETCYFPISIIQMQCEIPIYRPAIRVGSGPVFSYKLRYIVGFWLVEMAISTNQKPTIYRNLYKNTGPDHHATWSITLPNRPAPCTRGANSTISFTRPEPNSTSSYHHLPYISMENSLALAKFHYPRATGLVRIFTPVVRLLFVNLHYSLIIRFTLLSFRFHTFAAFYFIVS